MMQPVQEQYLTELLALLGLGWWDRLLVKQVYHLVMWTVWPLAEMLLALGLHQAGGDHAGEGAAPAALAVVTGFRTTAAGA